jgi:class 3 adenylate cyclase
MWQVAVYSEHQHQQFRAAGPRFRLLKPAGDTLWRLAAGEPTTSGAATICMQVAGDSILIDCRQLDDGVTLTDGGSFSSSVPIELPLPAIFQLGETWIEIRPQAAIERLALEPLKARRRATVIASPDAAAGSRGPDADTVAKWLSAAAQLHRMAASSPGFFDAAAQIALDTTGMDAAFVLTLKDGAWSIAGSAVLQPEHGISFEQAALALLERQPEVWRRTPHVLTSDATDGADASKVIADESIVVAPARDETGALVAAVYGVRHGRGDNRRRGIRTLEARVVDTIAEAVSVGLIRREQEIEAGRQRVLLEQAFTPAVAERLQRHPETLHGQTREVTLLFADLRGYTRLCERLPAADSCNLLADVMETLTTAIMDHAGVVIDYYGDGVTAMWNAPLDTPDHAERACAAAMQMLESLPAVSRQWEHLLTEPLQLVVGLHTGAAHVGNAGAKQRLKYGPRGVAVNIASRVQSAAKRLNVALLATGAVRKRLSSRFVTLKVCTARLPGLEQPLELFTVLPSTNAEQLQSNLEQYAEALDAFERGDFSAAESQLSELLDAGPSTPAAFLADQVAALRLGGLGRRSTDDFGYTPDAVIEILSK